MIFELIINFGLLFFFVYSYFYVGATLPRSAGNVIGPEQWPQLICLLLGISLLVNIVNIIRKNRLGTIYGHKGELVTSVKGFFNSKLPIAMGIVLAMSFLIEFFGFLVTCTLFLTAYGLLLGNKKYIKLMLISLVVTIFMYILFSVILGIMLPRGTIVFLRNWALGLESLVYSIKGVFR
jgi:hypothetical protein